MRGEGECDSTVLNYSITSRYKETILGLYIVKNVTKLLLAHTFCVYAWI